MSDGRSYAGESPADRAARRRRQLIDAGLALFGTEGYHRVTVRRLCAEARTSHRGFYEEFANTEDLLVAVYVECMDRLERAVVSNIPAGVDLAAGISAALDAFFAAVEDEPALGRVVWFEVLGVSDRVDDCYLERIQSFVTLLGALVDSRGLTGPLTGDRRGVVLRALVGGVSEVVRGWIKDGYASPRADLVEPLAMLVRVAAGGLLDGGP